MALRARSFETRIERRVAVLLLAFCVVPLVVLTWSAVRLIEDQTVHAMRHQLAGLSKSLALDVVDQLDAAVWELQRFYESSPDAGAPAPSEESWRWARLLDVAPRPAAMDRPALRAVADGFELLVPAGDEVLTGLVPDDVLFGALEHGPFAVRSCVLVDGELRRCGAEAPEGPLVIARWRLPLAGMYDTDVSIEVVSSQSREAALRHLGLAYRLLPYGVLVVMAVAGWWLLTRVRVRFAPIAELQRATERISAGDYRHQVVIESGDELERLGGAFNAMTRQLADSFDTMRVLSAMDHMILNGADLADVVRQALELMGDRGVAGGLVWLWEVDAAHGGEIFRLDDQGRLVGKRTPIPEQRARTHDIARRELEGAWPGAVQVTCPILREGELAGLLAAADPVSHSSGRADTLSEIADRISVAVTLYDRARALFRQAHYDGLTGLLNREAFVERVSQAARGGERDGHRGALLCLDLDRFKQVNDTAGHQVGDRLLAQVAQRVQAAIRATDEAARLGGDEFAVLVPQFAEAAEIESVCRRVMDEISRPLDVAGNALVVEASIGVVVFPDDGQDASVLMRKADVAMYKAKEQSGSAFTFFDEGMNRETEQRARTEGRLRQAMKDRELCLYFQPKVRVTDGAVVGVEGLLRWPAARDMHPGLFIPVAEQTGLIHELTDVLVQDGKACLERCRERGFALERVGVNVSPRQFQREGFAAEFLERLARHGANPGDFEVEVTESTLMHDPQVVARELEALRAAGVTIALDDFGTGYSSLNVLRELPLDVVKIDRSFVAPIAESSQARDLIGRIIDIIRSLRLHCVAEGVETEQEMQILLAQHCDVVQGFLFSPALSITDLVGFLEQRAARSA